MARLWRFLCFFFACILLQYASKSVSARIQDDYVLNEKKVDNLFHLKDISKEEEVDADFCDLSKTVRSNYINNAISLLLKKYGDIFEIYEGNLHFNQNEAGNPGGKYGVVHFTENVTSVNRDFHSNTEIFERQKTNYKQKNRFIEKNENNYTNVEVGREEQADLNVYPPLYCALNPFKGLNGPGIVDAELIRHLISPCDFTFIPSPRDAVVFLGCTPPLSDYFSIRSYLGVKEVVSNNVQIPNEKLQSPHLLPFKSYLPFAELGDPANILTLNTTKGTYQHNATLLLTSTGDEETRDIVSNIFEEVGFPREAMNFDIIPNDLVQFRNQTVEKWVDNLSDGIAIQFRVSGFHNVTQRDLYYNTTFPVIYLHAKSFSAYAKEENKKPLYRAPYRPKGTGDSQFQSNYTEALDFIQEKILNIFSTSSISNATVISSSSESKSESQRPVLSSNASMIHVVPDPIRCIQEPSTYYPIFFPHDTNYTFSVMPTCDWFSNDALYSLYPNISTTVLTFPLNRIYVLVGYDQSNLGRCMFYNLLMSTPAGFEQSAHTVNFTSADLLHSNKEILKREVTPFFSGEQQEIYKATYRRNYKRDLRSNNIRGLRHEVLSSQEETMLNSEESLQRLVNSTFTVFIARNCTFLVETYFNGNRDAIVCQSANTTKFAETDPLMFVERKYLEEETKTGPSQYEILPSRIFSIDF